MLGVTQTNRRPQADTPQLGKKEFLSKLVKYGSCMEDVAFRSMSAFACTTAMFYHLEEMLFHHPQLQGGLGRLV